MYVCICRQVTDSQIRQMCEAGCLDPAEVRARLGVAADCGKCRRQANTVVSDFLQSVAFTNAADCKSA